MIRINTLNRCGATLTIELMGYIHKTEFDILYDFLQEQVEEDVEEVCIVANEVRSLNPLMKRDASRALGCLSTRLDQLGLTLHFQQLTSSIRGTLAYWGMEKWIDDE